MYQVATCNCYACRNYFEECPERKHPKKDMIRARHKDGYFRWGQPEKGNGNWVKICRWCRDALMENAD